MKRLIAALSIAVVWGRSPARAQVADSAGAAVTAAQPTAEAWLRIMDQGRYGGGWDSAAALLKGAVTRSGWEEALRKARGPFEPFGSRELLGASFQTSLPNVPPGQYVVFQYRARVGRGRTVVETITPMKEPDGRWRVSGYYIRPE